MLNDKNKEYLEEVHQDIGEEERRDHRQDIKEKTRKIQEEERKARERRVVDNIKHEFWENARRDRRCIDD